MNKNATFKKCLLFIFTALISNISFSQKTNFIKLNLTNEFIRYKLFIPGVGMSFEKQITAHSGIETGFWYRPYRVHSSILAGDLFYNYTLKENHFSIPVLYKYYSPIVDIAVGPTIDFYGVWTIDKYSRDLKVISNEERKTAGIGFLIKASKTYQISNKFYLEPEIHANPLLSVKRNFIGGGMSVKYKL